MVPVLWVIFPHPAPFDMARGLAWGGGGVIPPTAPVCQGERPGLGGGNLEGWRGGGALRRGDAAPYGAACAHFLLHGPLGYPNTYTILGTTRYPGSPYAKTCQWRITHKHHARWQRNSERRPTCACTLVRNIDGLCGVVLSRRAPVGHPPYIYFWVVLFRGTKMG